MVLDHNLILVDRGEEKDHPMERRLYDSVFRPKATLPQHYQWNELPVRKYMMLSTLNVEKRFYLENGVVFSPRPLRMRKSGKVKSMEKTRIS